MTEDKFLLLLDQMKQLIGSITRLLSGDDHILETNSDDKPNRGESESQDRAPAEAQQGRNKALLKAILQDLNLKEKTGPAIEGELAIKFQGFSTRTSRSSGSPVPTKTLYL